MPEGKGRSAKEIKDTELSAWEGVNDIGEDTDHVQTLETRLEGHASRDAIVHTWTDDNL